MKKTFLLVLLILLCLSASYCKADTWWTDTDYIKLASQTADVSTDSLSVRINGVVKTVANVYNAAEKLANENGYNGSSKYACAAYPHKFYSEVFGIEIYNLSGPSYVPKVSSGGGSFSEVSTPRIGDIIRCNNSTHWGIVKSVSSDGTVTVIQQNAGYFNKNDNNNYYAMINTTIARPYSSVSFFRWSGASILIPADAPPDTTPPQIVSGSAGNITTSGFSVYVRASDNAAVTFIQIGTWNDISGIDNAKWQGIDVYGMDVSHTFYIDLAEFDNQVNTIYHVNVYALDSSDNRNPDAFRAADILIETEPPIVSGTLKDITTSGFNAYVQASDNAAVSYIQVGTWNDISGIDNAKWQGVNVSGTNVSYTFYIDLVEFDNQKNTIYHVNVYALDSSGNRNPDAFRAGDIYIETTPPVIGEHQLENITKDGYDVIFQASDNSAISKLQIGTWHSGMNIDDAQWQEIVIENQRNATASFHIDVSDFNNARDVTYYTNAYAFDQCGNVSAAKLVASIEISSNNPPEISSCQAINIGPRGYDIVCEAMDDHGVAYYVFGTWHDPMYIEDAFWEAVEADANGSVTYHVDPSSFYWTTGVNYYTRVIAFDENNERSEELEVTIFVPALDLYAERDESLTMYLPASLTAIQSGAFEGIAARYFVLPATVKTIEAGAFPAGSTVYLYGQRVTGLSPDLFGGVGTLVEMDASGNNLLAGDLLNSGVNYFMRNGAEIIAMTAAVDEGEIVGNP